MSTARRDAFEYLENRIARETSQMAGFVWKGEEATRLHAEHLANLADIVATAKEEIEQLGAQLPASAAAAIEEQRLEDIQSAQAELDEITAVDRRELARQTHAAELLARIERLKAGEEGSA
jgi:hypothetical protein